MPTLLIAGHPIFYNVNYQKGRKSIRLRVTSIDHVEIIAPSRYPKSDIEKLLQTKANWLTTQNAHHAQLAANPVNKKIAHGAQLLYLGQPYTLLIATASTFRQPSIIIEDNQLLVHLPTTVDQDNLLFLQTLLKNWYLETADKLLVSKTTLWANKLKVHPTRITLRDQKTRWGSCSSRGSINYNWRIVMAPAEVIDYLVIHELCHLRVPNHSQDFWQLVSQFSPNCKQCRAWLSTNGALLSGIL